MSHSKISHFWFISEYSESVCEGVMEMNENNQWTHQCIQGQVLVCKHIFVGILNEAVKIIGVLKSRTINFVCPVLTFHCRRLIFFVKLF